MKKFILSLLFILPWTLITGLTLHHLDGWKGMLGSLWGDDTIYAEKYSDTNFRKVEVGMDYDQVIQLIGKPLTQEIDQDEIRGWWTDQCCGGNFRQRLIFFKQHKVSEIDAEFYLD